MVSVAEVGDCGPMGWFATAGCGAKTGGTGVELESVEAVS